jgi:nitrite reductase/ring-hydroxylating ferredoxin subunit
MVRDRRTLQIRIAMDTSSRLPPGGDHATAPAPWPGILLARIPQGLSELAIDGTPVLVHRRGDLVRACPTSCRHHGARLRVQPGTDRAVCSWHGWILDTDAMAYVWPAGLHQPQLEVDVDVDSALVRISNPADGSSEWS